MPEERRRSSTVDPGSLAGWRDGKRYLWLIGLVVPSLAFIAFADFALTRWTAWLWIGPLLILVIVPILDLLVGLDPTNPPDEVIASLEQDRYYRRIVMAYLPIQYLGLAAAMYLIARGNPAPGRLPPRPGLTRSYGSRLLFNSLQPPALLHTIVR